MRRRPEAKVLLVGTAVGTLSPGVLTSHPVDTEPHPRRRHGHDGRDEAAGARAADPSSRRVADPCGCPRLHGLGLRRPARASAGTGGLQRGLRDLLGRLGLAVPMAVLGPRGVVRALASGRRPSTAEAAALLMPVAGALTTEFLPRRGLVDRRVLTTM